MRHLLSGVGWCIAFSLVLLGGIVALAHCTGATTPTTGARAVGLWVRVLDQYGVGVIARVELAEPNGRTREITTDTNGFGGWELSELPGRYVCRVIEPSGYASTVQSSATWDSPTGNMPRVVLIVWRWAATTPGLSQTASVVPTMTTPWIPPTATSTATAGPTSPTPSPCVIWVAVTCTSSPTATPTRTPTATPAATRTATPWPHVTVCLDVTVTPQSVGTRVGVLGNGQPYLVYEPPVGGVVGYIPCEWRTPALSPSCAPTGYRPYTPAPPVFRIVRGPTGSEECIVVRGRSIGYERCPWEWLLEGHGVITRTVESGETYRWEISNRVVILVYEGER